MNHPGRDPLSELERIARLGFEFVDFTLEPPAACAHLVDPVAVRAALDRLGLGVVAHTAWYLPVGSPYASLRRACLEEFRVCLAVAEALQAPIMNTHFAPPGGFFPESQVVAWHREVLSPLCEEAAGVGVQIVIEHVPGAGERQLETIEQLLSEVPALGFHLDSGHARLEGAGDRWGEYLERLGHRLAHVHLSDNDGSRDQHLALGSVPAPPAEWPERIAGLRRLGYDGTITLEVFTEVEAQLTVSRQLLLEWWRGEPG